MGEAATILLTGGTGKLGRQFVRHFLSQGAVMVVTSRSREGVERLGETLGVGDADGRLIGLPVDLATADAVPEMRAFLRSRGISPTCLINNARNLENLRLKEDGTPTLASWMGEFTLGVVQPYELSMALAALPGSRLRNIVNIASMYGVVPPTPRLYGGTLAGSPVHYGTVKAAMIHLTKELAVRLAANGIRVNCVSYGGVAGRENETFQHRYAELCPLGRMLHDDEVIGAIDFLVSKGSIGMTGHNLVVDGGWSVW